MSKTWRQQKLVAEGGYDGVKGNVDQPVERVHYTSMNVVEEPLV